MQCPRCHYPETKVIDSRDIDSHQTIRRRRECLNCESRFTTFEKIGFTELMVAKKDGTRQLYDRDKLKRSIMLACAKRRNVDVEAIYAMISALEVKRLAQGNEISSQQIGDDVIAELKKLDIVAYMRFASVYKKFESIDDFRQLIG
ncbi:transcriptional repressor NrdR [Patescibacteria group bacterium]|nr:transcriptional repressor NrdR [Patescibacteria group bacterium]